MKKNALPFLLVVIGIGLFLFKMSLPETIDSNGILHENFYLIILGYMSIFAGIVSFILVQVVSKIKMKREKEVQVNM